METEITGKVAFDTIRYAQCWEDADILLEGLDIQKGDVCLGIASAGDNCLSMLTRHPAIVIAVDINPAQLACLELRVAAYKCLHHHELLELIGSRPSEQRMQLFERCAPALPEKTAAFWRERKPLIEQGIGGAGRFEHYLRLARRSVLPLIHSRTRIDQLFQVKGQQECRLFYDQRWDNWRWRLLFKFFFSRWLMGRLGRDPSFFAYVEGSVADRILSRTRHALRESNPGENPYLHWILTGTHGEALPHALRPEHFAVIRDNIDRLECRLASLESTLEIEGKKGLDRLNLSDIFEYMSEKGANKVLENVVRATRGNGRLAYWNMLVPRSCPAEWNERVRRLRELGDRLHQIDKTFFYTIFVVEEVL